MGFFMKLTHGFFVTAFCAVLLVLGGCAAGQRKPTIMDYKAAVAVGDFVEADAVISTYTAPGSAEPGGKTDEFHLQQYLLKAEALRNLQQFPGALRLLDRSEEVVNGHKSAGGGKRLMRGLLQVGVGEAADTYRGRTFEKVLINAQKAAIFLETGDLANARVEYKRADDRIRRAVSEFSAEIAKEQAKLNADMTTNPDARVSQDSSTMEQVNEQFPEIAQWESYADFVNPIVTYMHALFYLVHGQDASDLNEAISSFERVAGMVPNNPALLSDLALAKAMQAGKASHPNEVWILQEDGVGPYLEPTKIQIPISRNGIAIQVIIALPKLRTTENFGGVLTVTENGKRSELTTISLFDRVVQTEFKKRWPMTVARATLSATIRALGNYDMARQGTAGKIFGDIFNQALSIADTKIWVGLPKHWKMTRVTRPADGTLRMELDGVELPAFNLPDTKFSIVHLRTNGGLVTRAPSILTKSPFLNIATR